MIEIKNGGLTYRVRLDATGGPTVHVLKTRSSRYGTPSRVYESVITSARKIRRFVKLAQAEAAANQRLADAFNDSGVFKPVFTCVGGR